MNYEYFAKRIKSLKDIKLFGQLEKQCMNSIDSL